MASETAQDTRPLWRRLLESRLGCDYAATDTLFRTCRTALPEEPSYLAGHARLLEELGDADAEGVWRAILRQTPGDLTASYQIAAHAVRRGAGPEEAVADACADGPEGLGAVVLDVLRNPVSPRGRGADTRHVAICGVSYCGSTLLDTMLGGMRGMATIGESHWLTRTYIQRTLAEFDFVAGNPADLLPCRTCGKDCRVLDFAFRRNLAADPIGWYGRIADRLGAGIVVSSDKNVGNLMRNDPLLRFDALILFKSPEGAWLSHRSKLSAERLAADEAKELASYLDIWADRYGMLSQILQPRGRKAFVRYEDLVAAPRSMLEGICAALDLPFDPAATDALPVNHAIGGNHQALRGFAAMTERLEVRAPETPDLPAPIAAAIAAHEGVQRVYAGMMELRIA